MFHTLLLLSFLVAPPVPVPTPSPVPPVIVPISEVVAGMHGYGLTVLSGTTVTRFDFVTDGVIENFAGYQRLFQVQLLGEPFISKRDALLSGTGVMGGMSGSPLYLADGRFLGALIMCFPGQRNSATAYIVPGESMLEMRRIAPKPAGKLVKTIPPGSSVSVCTVWGEFQHCGTATATFSDGEYVFTTGHELQSFSIGPLRLPVFEAPIIGLVATFSDASRKIPQRIGASLGVTAYNGWHGTLVRPDEVLEGIPVRVIVRGLADTPLERTCRIAPQEDAPSDLGDEVRLYLRTFGFANSEKYRVNVQVLLATDATITIDDVPLKAIGLMKKYLEKEFEDQKEGVSVKAIQIIAVALPK